MTRWAKTKLQQEALASLLEAALDEPAPSKRLSEAAQWAASALKHKEALRDSDTASTSGGTMTAEISQLSLFPLPVIAAPPRSGAEVSEAARPAVEVFRIAEDFGIGS